MLFSGAVEGSTQFDEEFSVVDDSGEGVSDFPVFFVNVFQDHGLVDGMIGFSEVDSRELLLFVEFGFGGRLEECLFLFLLLPFLFGHVGVAFCSELLVDGLLVRVK